ncbi:MAG TPA: bifunctional nuclease family protein [Ilumatobacter sp.]|nr:bifunctional nuclease family protein [Ilumatobacter sp.]
MPTAGQNWESAMDDMKVVEVLGLYLHADSGSAIVLLGDSVEGDRVLPIFIGPAEAQAIALGLANRPMQRPGTHDLLISALAAADARIASVGVVALDGGIFLGELEVVVGDDVTRVDARPSDAIALAVRAGVTVFVAAGVFDEAAVTVVHAAGEPFEAEEIEEIMSKFQEFLESTEPADFEAPPPDET